MITWSDEDKEKIRQAILALATGAAVVRVLYEGPPRREVEYHPQNLAALRALLAEIEGGTASRQRRRYVKFSKGFNQC